MRGVVALINARANQRTRILSCRFENLQEDMRGVVALINARKPPHKNPVVLPDTIPTRKQGPLLSKGLRVWYEEPDPDDIDGRHLSKYRDCGPVCMDLARIFYAQDFSVLKYDEVLPAADSER